MSTPLSKGQNGPLTASDVVVSLELTTPADLSALLVKADGKVRSDADFVFFNQPPGRVCVSYPARPDRQHRSPCRSRRFPPTSIRYAL